MHLLRKRKRERESPHSELPETVNGVENATFMNRKVIPNPALKRRPNWFIFSQLLNHIRQAKEGFWWVILVGVWVQREVKEDGR